MHNLTVWQAIFLAYLGGGWLTLFWSRNADRVLRRSVLWPAYWYYLAWRAWRRWRGLPV